jgi:hypothetical protein
VRELAISDICSRFAKKIPVYAFLPGVKLSFVIRNFAICRIFLLFSGVSSAADIPQLTDLFRETFVEAYTPRFCRDNVGRLIAAADKSGIDMRGAELVKLSSPDFWELNAFSARGYRLGDRRFFYFHYVLIADGYVFDYDFTDRAVILKVEDYFYEMFVPKAPVDIPYDYKKSFRSIFQLEAYSIPEYIKNGKSTAGIVPVTTDLAEYLDVEKIIEKANCVDTLRPVTR